MKGLHILSLFLVIKGTQALIFQCLHEDSHYKANTVEDREDREGKWVLRSFASRIQFILKPTATLELTFQLLHELEAASNCFVLQST